VDWEKLASGQMAAQLPADQLSQLRSMAGSGEVAIDLWFDKASGALREIVVTTGNTDGPDVQVTLLVSDPGTVSIEAPPDFVEVPVTDMIMTLAPLLMGGFAS
jgi:hypothetical protein